MDKICSVCGKPSVSGCGFCTEKKYCSKICQEKDWLSKHKENCCFAINDLGYKFNPNLSIENEEYIKFDEMRIAIINTLLPYERLYKFANVLLADLLGDKAKLIKCYRYIGKNLCNHLIVRYDNFGYIDMMYHLVSARHGNVMGLSNIIFQNSSREKTKNDFMNVYDSNNNKIYNIYSAYNEIKNKKGMSLWRLFYDTSILSSEETKVMFALDEKFS